MYKPIMTMGEAEKECKPVLIILNMIIYSHTRSNCQLVIPQLLYNTALAYFYCLANIKELTKWRIFRIK